VQTKIPSLALLIAGIGYGLANMLSSFKQLNNTDYKSTPLKLQIVADAAFMMYNAFQYRSSTPGWVKFGCLALSTGSKIMSKYYASGERLPPALPLTFTDWYTNALDENLRHILIEFACTATYKLEEATEDLFNYISRGDNLHKLIFSLVLAGMLKKAEEDTRMKGPIAKFLTIDVQIVSTVPHDKIARLLEDIEQANEIHPKTFLRKVITRFLDIRHAQMDQAGLTRIIQELQGINWTQDHETRGNEPDA
jgi:hypothetical protein